MPMPSTTNLNLNLTALCREGRLKEAFRILLTAHNPHVESCTYLELLQACVSKKSLSEGKQIHSYISHRGFAYFATAFFQNKLISMYIKCGSLLDARQVFDQMIERDAFSWNILIRGYRRDGFPHEALTMFQQMKQTGVQPNLFTFSSVLPACAKLRALEQGVKIHQSIIESGILSDVLANALVDMYAKCGYIQMARKLFEKMPQRNLISWTTMIAGYAQNGVIDEAIKLFEEMPQKDVFSWTTMITGYTQNGFVEKSLETFKQMQLAGVKPVSVTFISILPACAKLGALQQGYAQNGFCDDALKLFELMKLSGTYTDHISFACVLIACSNAGLVSEGCKYFNSMSDLYCITPTMDHYVCMVDLLARAGYLEESLNFIIKMPSKPVVGVWTCLLGVCRRHKNTRLGVFTANILFELDPENAETYVLLSNMYAEVGRRDEVQMVRRVMEDRGIKKIPGCSWIEDHKMVHAFTIGDRSHPQTQEIYSILEKLSWEMKAAGYFLDSRHVLNDVEEEEKELFLCHHSEKLAIAFGLLNTAAGTTIRVVKNLRVCVDCHTATKFISKIVERQIVVRDANRFHHFKGGQCSCGDYW
ncbi:pentatricopeptide repeat-containing protein At3g12770 [Cryptomeria japonica]|uniref:pentatricopeptide repeat-containing protein At3g12770 n=1 Tax=Cryptomeria japonica TaxID=3369 RepID=UPI0027DAA857|nr:pentatricopeptide repeat-containing protein At3g12770 [Cryptomeria japonica]